MAYCSDCGTPINDEEEYCESCKIAHAPQIDEKPTEEKPQNKIDLTSKFDFLKPFFWPILCFLLLTLLVLFIVLFIKANNKAIPADTSNLEGQVSALTSQLEAERTYSYQLTTDVSSAKAEVASLETTIIDLKASIAEYQLQISNYKSNIESNETTYNEMIGKLAIAENKLAECEATLIEKKSDLDAIEKELIQAQTELNTIKTSSIEDLENELYKMRNPRAFSSLEELSEFLYYDDTDYKYAKLSDVDKGYILYQHLLREGYFVSFMVENVEGAITTSGINYVYINKLGDYKINPSNDTVLPHRTNFVLEGFTEEADDYPYITR